MRVFAGMLHEVVPVVVVHDGDPGSRYAHSHRDRTLRVAECNVESLILL
jgi:hypothetical protein